MIRICKAALIALMLSLSSLAWSVGEDEPLVNINTADAVALAQGLTGVGDARAEAIVRYREEHGQFVDVYELANVKGIGERTVEMNAERIVLKD
ncbi:MAG: helix-hairpin-helix domain-containing protein [Gammaproteobacteria bacterium]|nr:helix-hairpin-helix domain-containing protein [Gammaproteobacteria bacterium]